MSDIFDLSDTWNSGVTTFTAIKMNVTDTASAAGSLLFDMQIGGVSKFRIGKTAVYFSNSGNSYITSSNGYIYAPYIFVDSLECNNTTLFNKARGDAGGFGFVTGNNIALGAVAGFSRKADGVPEINNGTKGTYTGTALLLGTQTVAQLPTAATAGSGARATVSDALTPTFGATVASGGAVVTPVYSDGTNWKVG